MHDFFRTFAIRLLRVPPAPHIPAGSPDSIRVFRAAPNFYRLQLVHWGLKQLAAMIGFAVFIGVWHSSLAAQVPAEVHPWIKALKIVGIAGFVLQIPFTFAMVRLDYEMRWYIVTDRSLRIRAGLWQVAEMTLSFANLQQISVHQGPLQRLLGLYDLEVSTAGGGAPGPTHAGRSGTEQDSHCGFLHGIDNAPEIRDMMLERLRQMRDAGLGDPDEHTTPSAHPAAADSPALVAARELLEEARALKRTLC